MHCTATQEGRRSRSTLSRPRTRGRAGRTSGTTASCCSTDRSKAGRTEAQIGGHLAGHNTKTLGVVYVARVAADGKTPKNTQTPAQEKVLLAIVKGLIGKYPTVARVWSDLEAGKTQNAVGERTANQEDRKDGQPCARMFIPTADSHVHLLRWTIEVQHTNGR